MKAILGIFALGIVGWAAVSFPGSSKPANTDRIKNYRSWHRATKLPVDMTPGMAVRCAGPLPVHRPPNPHAHKVFLVYVNAIGKAAMMKKGKPDYPDGTVIVKEKYDRGAGPYNFDPISDKKLKAITSGKPELLTVMFKEKGEWTYFAVDADGKEMKGDIAYCGKCHEKAKSTGFVFRDYIPTPIY